MQGEVCTDELEYDEEDHVFTHPCRCGGEYILTSQDLEMTFDFATCDTCSLTVKILPVSQSSAVVVSDS